MYAVSQLDHQRSGCHVCLQQSDLQAATALQACQLNVPRHHQAPEQSDKLKGYFGDQSG